MSETDENLKSNLNEKNNDLNLSTMTYDLRRTWNNAAGAFSKNFYLQIGRELLQAKTADDFQMIRNTINAEIKTAVQTVAGTILDYFFEKVISSIKL